MLTGSLARCAKQKQQLTKKLIKSYQNARNKCQYDVNPQMGHISLPPQSRDLWGKIINPGVGEGKYSALWVLQDHSIHQLIAVIVVYSRIAHHPASQDSSMKWEGAHDHPVLRSIDLLTVNDFLEKKSQFSLRVRSMVGQAWSSGCTHTYEYMGTTNWNWWVPKERKKGYKVRRKWEMEVDLREMWGKSGTND